MKGVGPHTRLLGLVFRVYKAVGSPLLHAISPAQCKFLPTCSEYAYVALARRGVLAGSVLALRRVARCHPFAQGGLDPVPESDDRSKEVRCGMQRKQIAPFTMMSGRGIDRASS